jgi:hypothetical protein
MILGYRGVEITFDPSPSDFYLDVAAQSALWKGYKVRSATIEFDLSHGPNPNPVDR